MAQVAVWVGRDERRRRTLATLAMLLPVLCVLMPWTPAAGATTRVTGTIRSYSGGRAVPAVVMTLTGSGATSAATDATGAYSFDALVAGDFQVRPTKLGGLSGAVSLDDAIWVLQSSVGSRQLNDMQRLAADVTGDGTVSALDAARIMQVAAGLRGRLPIAEACGSDWVFMPAPTAVPNQHMSAPQAGPPCVSGVIAFTPLVGLADGQDFFAVPFGDCTGDWQANPPPSGTPTPTRPATATASPTRTFTATPTPVATRDWRRWPFSRYSPWNHPIGSAAHYTPVNGLAQLAVAINYGDRWTSSVAVAAASDPLSHLLFSPNWGAFSSFAFLSDGGLNCGNTAADEERLLSVSEEIPPRTDGNYYSTIDASTWLLPSDFHRAGEDWRSTFRLPLGVCPSPDPDGLLAVIQPDGWVLDAYAAVVTADRRVVASMASWIDARGDGTGWWGGRRASMLPSFAGLIRTGEITAGRIPHALAVLMPATMLRRTVAWPAYAFDREPDYTGSVPMGALLAIPPSVDVAHLGLSTRGTVLARAAQDYGVYVVDRGGTGITVLAELGNPDIRWEAAGGEPAAWKDLEIIGEHLQWIDNNGPAAPGGGGTPRQPLAPPVSASDL